MAPECTGYMVRSANRVNANGRIVQLIYDQASISKARLISDLYSFGCILYRLCCGRAVFKATERMDLVYLHVAIEPKPPSERCRHLPQPLSDLIMHLLQKNAEQRYQTAFGVLTDIEELLGRWIANLPLGDLPFSPGQADHKTQLIVPTYVFGRSHELGVLRETCDAASRKNGGLHVVMLKGKSGTGKTKLLMEVRKIACVKRAIFASAKFDQYKRDLPFSAYISILRALANVLLPFF
jgi:serine/threonine protein kinase